MVNPEFHIDHQMVKEVGLVGSKTATMNVKIVKSFFLAGEMAYM